MAHPRQLQSSPPPSSTEFQSPPPSPTRPSSPASLAYRKLATHSLARRPPSPLKPRPLPDLPQVPPRPSSSSSNSPFRVHSTNAPAPLWNTPGERASSNGPALLFQTNATQTSSPRARKEVEPIKKHETTPPAKLITEAPADFSSSPSTDSGSPVPFILHREMAKRDETIREQSATIVELNSRLEDALAVKEIDALTADLKHDEEVSRLQAEVKEANVRAEYWQTKYEALLNPSRSRSKTLPTVIDNSPEISTTTSFPPRPTTPTRIAPPSRPSTPLSRPRTPSLSLAHPPPLPSSPGMSFAERKLRRTTIDRDLNQLRQGGNVERARSVLGSRSGSTTSTNRENAPVSRTVSMYGLNSSPFSSSNGTGFKANGSSPAQVFGQRENRGGSGGRD
ncbi:hypothetical protein RQP46_010208 [Phenoliferia psychrophenolica]